VGHSAVRAVLNSERGRMIAVWAIFAAAAAASIVVLGYAGRGQTLKGDEWGYAGQLATESLPDALFNTPPGKYLLVLPMLLYKGAFSTVGISHYLPYRIAGMLLTIAAAALFLVLAARRVGYLVALPGAALIMFLGSASEVTTTALRIPEQIAVIAGLAALLALERRDLRGDIAGCILLLISITSHPLGAGFVAAAVVLVFARPGSQRWRCAWIVAVPLLLFGVWYLTLREPAPDSVGLGHQLGDLPRFEFQSLATMVGAVTGAFYSPFTGAHDPLTALTYALAVIVIVAVGLRALTVRLPASFWAILAAVIVLFAAPAFAPGALRQPTASRYVFAGAIMLMLLLCEAFGDISPRPSAWRAIGAVALVAVFGYAVYANGKELWDSAHSWGARGAQVRSELAALDLARGHIASGFDFVAEDPSAQPPVPSTHTGITAFQYFVTAQSYGSPAFTPSELASAPVPDRLVADGVLARAYGLQLRPIPSVQRSAKATRPRAFATEAHIRDSGPGCITVTPSGEPAASQIALPPGGVQLSTSGGQPVKLALGRFGPGYGYPLQPPLQPNKAALLFVPRDAAQTPWRLLIRPTKQPVTACGVKVSGFQQ
jgi:hypothetical protein